MFIVHTECHKFFELEIYETNFFVHTIIEFICY